MPVPDPASTMTQTRAALDRLEELAIRYPGPKAFGKGTAIAWINLSNDDQSAALASLEAFAALLAQTGRARWPTLANYIQTKRWRFLPAQPPAERRADLNLSLFFGFLKKAGVVPSESESAAIKAAWPTNEFHQVDTWACVDRYIAAARALGRPLDFAKWVAHRNPEAGVCAMERQVTEKQARQNRAAAQGRG